MFSQSCSNVCFNKGILQADCRRTDGTSKRSKIDLDKYIANENGNLILQPNGQFSRTCTDMSISDGVLHCLALQANGQFRQAASIDLNNFVKNDNGNLVWLDSSIASTNYSINNGILRLDATLRNGSSRTSSLSLDDWIGNNDGQLVIMRDGNFSRSCSALRVDNGVLRCMASRISGEEIPSQLDLKQFLKNDNFGNLQWIPDISSWSFEDAKQHQPKFAASQVPYASNRCNPVDLPHMSAFSTPSTTIR
jgi:hypothetical protein